jgi:hypothetical protein
MWDRENIMTNRKRQHIGEIKPRTYSSSALHKVASRIPIVEIWHRSLGRSQRAYGTAHITVTLSPSYYRPFTQTSHFLKFASNQGEPSGTPWPWAPGRDLPVRPSHRVTVTAPNNQPFTYQGTELTSDVSKSLC